MSVDFWWVRHGPTHAKTLIGHTDIAADLSDTAGLHRLKNFLPTKAYFISSDLIRAKTTARKLLDQHREPVLARSLREIDFGVWEGRSFEDIAVSDPDISREYWEHPGDIAPENGESWNVFSTRIHNEINLILNRDHSRNIVLVAHFGVILAALQLAGNLPARSVFSFKIDNLSVTRICHFPESNSWAIKSVNQNI